MTDLLSTLYFECGLQRVTRTGNLCPGPAVMPGGARASAGLLARPVKPWVGIDGRRNHGGWPRSRDRKIGTTGLPVSLHTAIGRAPEQASTAGPLDETRVEINRAPVVVEQVTPHRLWRGPSFRLVAGTARF